MDGCLRLSEISLFWNNTGQKIFYFFPGFPQDAQAYAEENGLLFMETSAKTAMNVNELFLAIGKKN